MRKVIWIMPDKRDERFSKKIWRRFIELAKSLGLSGFSIEICEQYKSEETPHYHMKVDDKVFIDLPIETGIDASYLATANGETYEGKMRLRVICRYAEQYRLILTSALFSYYDEYIRKYYPEWKTDYKNIEFSNKK